MTNEQERLDNNIFMLALFNQSIERGKQEAKEEEEIAQYILDALGVGDAGKTNALRLIVRGFVSGAVTLMKLEVEGF